MNTKELIRILGGPAEVARQLDLPPNDVGAKAVRAWCMRDSIPAEYFVDLARIARDAGKVAITEQSLSQMARRRRVAKVDDVDTAAA